MMMVFRPMLLLVISVLAGGFLAGWRGKPEPDEIAEVATMSGAEELAEVERPEERLSLQGLTGWKLFRALPEFLAAATAEELETLAADWGNQIDANTYPSRVWKLVLVRWLELDPKEALRSARRLDATRGEVFWLDADEHLDFCYTTWLHRDYEAARAFALAKQKPPYGRLLDAVAKHDPDLGLQWAEKDRNLVYPFMLAWARHDLEGATEAVDRFPSDWRAGLLSGLARSHAEVDPRKAVALLEEIGEPLYHNRAATTVLTKLAKIDLGAAQAALDKMPLGETRARGLKAIAMERARKDPEAAWTWAKSLAPQDKREVLHLCLERLAREDHRKVLSLIGEVGWEYAVANTRNRPADVVYQALLTLAKEDPRQALAQLAKTPKEASFSGKVEPPYYIATEIGRQWFQQDPLTALEWMQGAPLGEEGESVPENAFHGATPDQLAVAADYLINNPDGPHTGIMGQQVIDELASTEPMDALEVLERLDAVGALRSPNGEDVGESAYGTIAGAMSERDSMAASEWVRELPPGGRRDAAVVALVYELIDHPTPEYEAAFHWATTIENSELRHLKDTWRSWHEREPTRAEEVLEKSDLSDSMKTHLRTPYK